MGREEAAGGARPEKGVKEGKGRVWRWEGIGKTTGKASSGHSPT